MAPGRITATPRGSSGSLFDQETLARARGDPGGWAAASAPGLVGLRVAVFRFDSLLGFLLDATARYKSQVGCRNAVVGDLLFDLGRDLGEFFQACLLGANPQRCQFRFQF